MKRDRMAALLRVVRDDGAQIIPFMALVSILFLGMAGLSMDLGRAYFCYRQLQASTDAAALAGGYAMAQAGATTTTVTAAIDKYSSMTGDYNANPNLTGANVPAPTYSCVNNTYTTGVYCTAGVSCSASASGCNVVQVVQTATVSTLFMQVLRAFGVKPTGTLTLSATATALMRGSANEQYNVAVILDSTGSMGQPDTDGNCSGHITKEVCALQGIQDFLSGLTPCGPGSSSSTCKSAFDSVALFTFPNSQANTTTDATTCSGTTPTSVPYSIMAAGTAWTAPTGSAPNYEVTSGFLDSYSATNAAGGSIVTSPANPMEIATGADTGRNCQGLTQPISGQGTYLAGVIYAAQSALIAEQTANVGSLNAIVLLTDGDANATNTFTDTSGNTLTAHTTPALNTNGTYPSMSDQCEQAIGAAQYAAAHGTAFYVIAYEAGTSGCSTDTSTYQDPCANLQKMALQAGETSPYTPYAANFYSDATTGTHGNGGQCTSSANPNLTLSQVFGQVATSFTQARLIPN
jgi:hypothetical protein